MTWQTQQVGRMYVPKSCLKLLAVLYRVVLKQVAGRHVALQSSSSPISSGFTSTPPAQKKPRLSKAPTNAKIDPNKLYRALRGPVSP